MGFTEVYNEYSSAWPGSDTAYTDTAAAVTIPKAARWRFYATTDCWVRRCKTGDATAASTDGSTFWPGGTIWYEDITADDIARSENRFSVIRADTNGTLRLNTASRV